MKHNPSPELLAASRNWWNNLPVGRKNYLRAHQRLTNPQKIAEYYRGAILPSLTESK